MVRDEGGRDDHRSARVLFRPNRTNFGADPGGSSPGAHRPRPAAAAAARAAMSSPRGGFEVRAGFAAEPSAPPAAAAALGLSPAMRSFLVCVFYGATSGALALLNKSILSSYHFNGYMMIRAGWGLERAVSARACPLTPSPPLRTPLTTLYAPQSRRKWACSCCFAL